MNSSIQFMQSILWKTYRCKMTHSLRPLSTYLELKATCPSQTCLTAHFIAKPRIVMNPVDGDCLACISICSVPSGYSDFGSRCIFGSGHVAAVSAQCCHFGTSCRSTPIWQDFCTDNFAIALPFPTSGPLSPWESLTLRALRHRL